MVDTFCQNYSFTYQYFLHTILKANNDCLRIYDFYEQFFTPNGRNFPPSTQKASYSYLLWTTLEDMFYQHHVVSPLFPILPKVCTKNYIQIMIEEMQSIQKKQFFKLSLFSYYGNNQICVFCHHKSQENTNVISAQIQNYMYQRTSGMLFFVSVITSN